MKSKHTPPQLVVMIFASFLLVSGALTSLAQGLSTRNAAVKSTAKRWAHRKLVKIRTRAGDTLSLLGDRFGISADEIADLNGTTTTATVEAGRELLIPLPSLESLAKASARIADGANAGDSTVDQVWEQVQGVWIRKRTPTRVNTSQVAEAGESGPSERPTSRTRGRVVEAAEIERRAAPQPVWIFLVGGARVEADSVNETPEGVWYTHGNLSIFIERSRIERIDRERAGVAPETSGKWSERGWSTGNDQFDALIRENGTRFGVDPYLIFCVMEQESRFKPRVVSPKGARGLMQLMPGTAARFGVRRPFDPAENIMGGTRYLKQLLENFDGRVDLVLAGYNAGEGAVAKYGRNVPPYRETRNYVQRITKRYGQSTSGTGFSTESTNPGLR